MKVLDFLKQKSTRIIAFVSACIIFAVCAAGAISRYFSIQNLYAGYNEFRDSERIEEIGELFSELWVVGNMYLRNLDENGKFVGSKELKDSTEKALKELGLMDEKGNITISEHEDLYYYVSWGKNSISTDNRSYDDIYDSEAYSTTQLNGHISHSMFFTYYYYNDAHWYTTDYGMTYYDFPHTINDMMATAVFDYDTTDLDYYLDNYGVTIYYKKDGSTPVPTPETFSDNIDIEVYRYDGDYNEYYSEIREEGYYDEYGRYVQTVQPNVPNAEVFEITSEKINIPEIPDNLLEYDENSYILYDKENNEWVKVKNHSTQYGNEVPLKICITPSENLLVLYKQYINDISRADEIMTRFLLAALPFLALSAILILFFIVTSGYDVKKKKFVMNSTDKIWAEAVIATGALFAGAFVFSLDAFSSFINFMKRYSENYQLIVTSLYITAWTAALAFEVLFVNTIINRLKCRSLLKTTLCYKIWDRFIKKIFGRIYRKTKSNLKFLKDMAFDKDMKDNKIFVRRFLIKVGLFILVTLFMMSLNAEPSIVWVIIAVVYIYFSLKDINAITELSKHINDIYGGDYSAKEVHMSLPTYTMTEKLNNISDGIQTAVDKRLQSERMKIDLVTNVSHDLKTPLTSIISYINLLSMEELSPVARDYVKILEQKSERLREIVADVFDIAKATSRTDINFEMIDAVILVEQVLGDMSDRIEKSGREIRKTVSAETAPVYADGKKLYRVLQNIIDNALKYSLESTRIYLTLKKENGNAVITVKNISSYEIKFTPEEITERFTRGDESRTTEGSGLGLSIAKSFTEACGGRFEIIIDGDVFEADVTLPITIKEK
ncbi:MAG: HAMP domain-containing histidine kinase [Ruminococcus sp.]|nr:HAMP domain-containing histidine kinase [Ruminococcus sp.]